MCTTTRKLYHPGMWAAAIGLLVLMGGCQPAKLDSAQWVAPKGKLALHQVANELGLAIVHTSYSTATLRNNANTVVLYSDPEGQAYVNGQAVPNSGGIKAEDGTLMVPAGLAARLRGELCCDRGPTLAGAPERPGLPDVPEVPGPHEPVRPPPLGKLGVVVIDAGHGGKDPGTTSVLGPREKDVVLNVAKMVAAELRQLGADARLTRSGDTFLELEDRPAVADRSKAALFVSIHADYSDNHAAQGFTIYVSPSAGTQSQVASRAVLKRLCDSCNPSRGVKTAKYKVLVHANVPAMLVELGFMSNRAEAAALGSLSYQQRIARAIAHGCADYLARR